MVTDDVLVFSDHHEEEANPLHCQLFAARPILLVPGLVVFSDL